MPRPAASRPGAAASPSPRRAGRAGAARPARTSWAPVRQLPAERDRRRLTAILATHPVSCRQSPLPLLLVTRLSRRSARPRPARRSGRTAIPTALRACRPASPNTSSSSSLAPLTTWGWPVKSGALATKPVTLTMRRIAARPPAAEAAAASAFSAQIRASALASAGADLGADLARGEQLPVDHRELAGRVDVAPGADGRNVGRQRRRHLRQRQAERGEPLLGRRRRCAHSLTRLR